MRSTTHEKSGLAHAEDHYKNEVESTEQFHAEYPILPAHRKAERKRSRTANRRLLSLKAYCFGYFGQPRALTWSSGSGLMFFTAGGIVWLFLGTR